VETRISSQARLTFQTEPQTWQHRRQVPKGLPAGDPRGWEMCQGTRPWLGIVLPLVRSFCQNNESPRLHYVLAVCCVLSLFTCRVRFTSVSQNRYIAFLVQANLVRGIYTDDSTATQGTVRTRCLHKQRKRVRLMMVGAARVLVEERRPQCLTKKHYCIQTCIMIFE
jgi:hypothetical protein